jgi:hypothetical protein
MPRSPLESTAIALALVVSLTGDAPLAIAQAAETATPDQPAGTQRPASGPGAAEQNRSGGQFSPGGVPTKNQATTQPSVPPNGVGAMQRTTPGGDFGPGGAPTTGQAATDPSRQGPASGAPPSDNHARE